MDASNHPVVIEYAVRQCFKKQTPKTAASYTKKNFDGSSNLFIGGGNSIIEIDAQILENNIWIRMALMTIENIPRMKEGFERFAVEGTLQHFGQKVTPKNINQLEKAIEIVKESNS